VNQTPHIDRLAREGALLTATYCTNSICSPSRATILTGTYSHVNGVPGIYAELDYRVPTYEDAMHDAGYQTAIFGKWHLGESEIARPRSFDEWLVFPGQGAYVDPVMIGPDGERVVPGYATDIVTDLAIDWLERRDPDRPFALMIHHKAPHRPWIPDPKHKDMYAVGTIREPETFLDDHAGLSEAVRQVTMSIADDLTERDVKEPTPPELEGPERTEDRARWKYQRYMRDYLQLHPVDRRQRRARARPPRGIRSGRQHGRRVLLRPGLLPRRPRLVRQAAHVRAVAADAGAAALAGGDPCGFTV